MTLYELSQLSTHKSSFNLIFYLFKEKSKDIKIVKRAKLDSVYAIWSQ